MTVSMDCNCFLSVVGANGNTVHLGPNYDKSNASSATTSCPASLNAFSNPTDGAAVGGLYSCMSWVIPAASLVATTLKSSSLGTVVVTMHFALSCWEGGGCGNQTKLSQTNVVSSGQASEVSGGPLEPS